jgi:hypothetical protein
VTAEEPETLRRCCYSATSRINIGESEAARRAKHQEQHRKLLTTRHGGQAKDTKGHRGKAKANLTADPLINTVKNAGGVR